jgi:TrpR-related protein YerC/YecD
MNEAAMKSVEMKTLFRALLSLKNECECEVFLRDVCTLQELKDIASRLEVARRLNVEAPESYITIAKKAQVSTATVTRVSHWLHHGGGGYHMVLKRLAK